MQDHLMDVPESEDLIKAYHKSFNHGTDLDLWGQFVEAIDVYCRLSSQLETSSSDDSLVFSDEQKKILKKIAICLTLRAKSLQNPGKVDGVTLNDLKKVGETLKNLPHQKSKDFPIDVASAQLQEQSYANILFQQNGEMDEEKSFSTERGNLLPRLLAGGRKMVLTIKIEKIGLKDAVHYIDPYFTVTVKDREGKDLTSHQDTPVALGKVENYVVFNVEVHIQKTIDSLPPGFAVFFEFKHYKPKKKAVSTKCWAFLERDEMKDGAALLELYRKPTDYKRKKINLLTVKPLFLHLKLSLNV